MEIHKLLWRGFNLICLRTNYFNNIAGKEIHTKPILLKVCVMTVLLL